MRTLVALLVRWSLALLLVHVAGSALGTASSPRPANPLNITVYHVVNTLFQQSLPAAEREWPVNMDTGDLGGDMYFDIGDSQMELLECARNSSGGLNYSASHLVKVNCEHDQNAEVWDRKHLALAELVIEVDRTAFRDGFGTGEFTSCDAQGRNHTMDCHCQNPANRSQTGNEFCDPFVGRFNLTNATGSPYGVWDHGNMKDPTRIDYWRYNVADLLGGHWYSTPETGLCGRPGSPCTWRVAEVVKKVSRTCHNEMMFDAVTEYANQVGGWAKACFNACPQPSNTSTAILQRTCIHTRHYWHKMIIIKIITSFLSHFHYH